MNKQEIEKEIEELLETQTKDGFEYRVNAFIFSKLEKRDAEIINLIEKIAKATAIFN